ncbi:MAG: tyrosine--tRNA ligase [Rickettsiales bacterium]|nr:tyrosine--tRNA ligase [Rickettsiales bacterium]
MNLKSNILTYLNKRGFLHQITDPNRLDKIFSKEKLNFYIGFDLTAQSLHIGSLLPLMLVRYLQNNGHQPIILLGSATTKIGDPSGKDQTRKMLTPEVINNNKNSIINIFRKFLNFEADNKPIIVDNDSWLKDYNYIDFLREVGSKFSVNQMLRYESVKQRLDREQNLSFIEFNYMLLQAFDFVYLKNNYNVSLQIGGSDQWGNIINGIELYRKTNPKQEELIGLTTPLLTDDNGKKMGKTESGAIWLDENLFSAYDYFQFFRNIADSKVISFLNLFTEISEDKISSLAKLEGKDINEAKEILAYEATKICHGEDAAKKASETAKKVFVSKEVGAGLPIYELKKDEEISLSQIALNLKIVQSGGEAKRVIKGGGCKINEEKITDPFYKINSESFNAAGDLKISLGKKKYFIVRKI